MKRKDAEESLENKGSSQIKEEHLLEEHKLSLPSAYGSQTFFHGQLTAPLSLLTLCLHSMPSLPAQGMAAMC